MRHNSCTYFLRSGIRRYRTRCNDCRIAVFRFLHDLVRKQHQPESIIHVCLRGYFARDGITLTTRKLLTRDGKLPDAWDLWPELPEPSTTPRRRAPRPLPLIVQTVPLRIYRSEPKNTLAGGFWNYPSTPEQLAANNELFLARLREVRARTEVPVDLLYRLQSWNNPQE